MADEYVDKIKTTAQTDDSALAASIRCGFSIGYFTGFILATIFAITFIPVAFIAYVLGPLYAGAFAVLIILLHVYGHKFIKSFVIEVLIPSFINSDVKQFYAAIMKIMEVEKVL